MANEKSTGYKKDKWKTFVNERHSRKISQMSTGLKKGRWKTYVYVDGKRKEIAGKTEDDVYESLYEHYSTLEMRPKSLSDVFELLKDRKQNELAGVKKQLGKMFGYLIILAKP
ncbi:MAG: hypothetical protein IJX83_06155 [Lachnospiraceae bacterium]|nr:hypothetical protein [Lachnospiraceae bacterium]